MAAEIVYNPNPLEAPAYNDGLDETQFVISKATLGLDQVDNTADVNKPVSTLQQQAITRRMLTVNTIADLATTYGAEGLSLRVRETKRGGNFMFYGSGYVADGGLVFAAAGGGFWVRQPSGPEIFLEWWDGLDLTGTTNMSTRLAGIINSLPNRTKVLFPEGILRITSQLAVTKSVSWDSAGTRSKILVDGTFSPAITFTGVDDVTVNKIEIYKEANKTASTLLFFDNSSNITVTRNYIHDGGAGVTFRKVNNAVVRYNVINNTNLSGIRGTKNGNTSVDACSNFVIENNYLDNNNYSHTAGNGGIFFGSDGGTSGHSNIKILVNFVYNQGAMCIAMDGRGYDIEVGGNIMTQSASATSTETMAWGGGTGQDGMKRLSIHNNYMEQLNPSKADGGCILLYSNVTDVDIVGNHTKGGPQAFYFHFPFDHSYIANVNITANVFENTPQGVLFYKNGTNALTDVPANINIVNNTFSGVTTMAEYSTLASTEQNFRILTNLVNGKMEMRGNNLESIYALPKAVYLGQYTSTGSLTTQIGGVYQVRPLNTGNPTKVLIGSSAALTTPDQRMAGLEIELSGTSYNTSKVSMTASNGTVRKTMATGRLDTGDVPILEMAGAWNNGLLKIGSLYLWSDGTALRVKSSLPTSATDGTLL